MVESSTHLAERLARLEERFASSSERAAEDRAEMKEALSDVKADLHAVKEEVGAIGKRVQSAVDQIIGGKKALGYLYALGGFAVLVIGWASGVWKQLISVVIR